MLREHFYMENTLNSENSIETKLVPVDIGPTWNLTLISFLDRMEWAQNNHLTILSLLKTFKKVTLLRNVNENALPT
jgi:hypothetical protein